MLGQTAADVGRYAAVFYHAAADAWKEQKQRQQERGYYLGAAAAANHVPGVGVQMLIFTNLVYHRHQQPILLITIPRPVP